MPVLNPSQLSEETRHDNIAEGILSGAPAVAGVQCVRHITPLVMAALQRANNPFITGQKGFAAIGIEFDEQGNHKADAAQFGIALMPKTAEVLILLSCPREDLKRFAVDPAALESAALDFVDESTMDALAEATVFISEQLQGISQSQVTPAPDEEKPAASGISEGAGRSKKRAPTG